jgi:hypothetical protein
MWIGSKIIASAYIIKMKKKEDGLGTKILCLVG